MTVFEAFNAVECAADGLGICDSFGERISGVEALGCVARVFGERWDTILDQLRRGKISPDEYVHLCLEVIDQHGRDRLREKLERKLHDLKLDQAELDLVTTGGER